MAKNTDYKLEYIELLRDDYGYNVNGWNTDDPFVSIIWGNTIYSDTRENIINALVVEGGLDRELLESESNLKLLNLYKETFKDEILDDDMDLNTIGTLDRWYNDQVEEDLKAIDLTEEDEELIEDNKMKKDDNNIIDLEKQKEAVKILEKNPKAYAVIYGYTTPDNGIKYLDPMLKKYSQEEVEEYENSFRNGKAALDTILHVVYRSQLGKYKKDSIKQMTLEEFFKEAPGDSYIWYEDVFIYKIDKNRYFNSEELEIQTFDESDPERYGVGWTGNEIEEVHFDGKKLLEKKIKDWLDLDDMLDDEDFKRINFYKKILGDSDNLTNDSKQKQICDSFADRYKVFDAQAFHDSVKRIIDETKAAWEKNKIDLSKKEGTMANKIDQNLQEFYKVVEDAQWSTHPYMKLRTWWMNQLSDETLFNANAMRREKAIIASMDEKYLNKGPVRAADGLLALMNHIKGIWLTGQGEGTAQVYGYKKY